MLSTSGVPILINGVTGRIGTNLLRGAILDPTREYNILGANDVALDPKKPALNFVQAKAYDTVFGPFPFAMEAEGNVLVFPGLETPFRIPLFTEKFPAKLPFRQLGITGVADCTGRFLSRGTAEQPGYGDYYVAGAKCVALSAPAKEDGVLTVVLGVHTTPLKGVAVLSGASCTSGSIAFPLWCLLQRREAYGFSTGGIVTTHGYTLGEQSVLDILKPIASGCRRMYAAACNIVPTTTGAAKAIPKVDGLGEMAKIPFGGFALRVPVPSGSVTTLAVILDRQPPLADVIAFFSEMAAGPLKGRFAVNENPCTDPKGRPLVSSHIVARSESSILDVEFCLKLGPLYILSCWYGNEWGYAMRILEAVHEQNS